MKLRDSNLASLLLVLLGIALIIMHAYIKAKGMVVCAGIVFIITSVVTMALWQRRSRAAKGHEEAKGSRLGDILGWITTSAGILLGLAMLIWADTFQVAVPYCLGALMGVATLSQIYALLWGTRPVTLPSWLWGVPALMLAAAVWDFFLKGGVDDAMLMVVTGAGMIIFGLGLCAEGILLRQWDKATGTMAVKASQDQTAQPL